MNKKSYSIIGTVTITTSKIYFEDVDWYVDVTFYGENPQKDSLLELLSDNVADDIISIEIMADYPQSKGVIGIEYNNDAYDDYDDEFPLEETEFIEYAFSHEIICDSIDEDTGIGYGNYKIIEIITLGENDFFEDEQFAKVIASGYLTLEEAKKKNI